MGRGVGTASRYPAGEQGGDKAAAAAAPVKETRDEERKENGMRVVFPFYIIVYSSVTLPLFCCFCIDETTPHVEATNMTSSPPQRPTPVVVFVSRCRALSKPVHPSFPKRAKHHDQSATSSHSHFIHSFISRISGPGELLGISAVCLGVDVRWASVLEEGASRGPAGGIPCVDRAAGRRSSDGAGRGGSGRGPAPWTAAAGAGAGRSFFAAPC